MSRLSINQTAIDTVIFDFDGTLAKLNIDFDGMRRAVSELVSRYGVDHQVLQNRFVLEMINEAEALLQKSSHQQSDAFTGDAYRIIEGIEVEAARRGELFSETKHLLSVLKERSLRAGIITRNCVQAVHTVFPDIASYCAVVVCRDDVQHVKPHPEQLTRALSLLDSSPTQAIMIGDHPLDIETGRNAGTLAAGVLTGHFSTDDFIRAGADIILPKASDLLKLLV
ncbi:MAG: HAD family hydrolase [Deltaproteobacteria bacterium]